MKKLLLLSFIFIAAQLPLSAQTDSIVAPAPWRLQLSESAGSTFLPPHVITSDCGQHAQVKKESKHFTPTKTPMVAVGLSAVVPGLGQIYNENYWKAPVILGLGGYWVSEWLYNSRQYHDFQDQYSQSLIDAPGQGNSRLLQLRDFYRDERDKFAWYIGVLYFANLVDAYVSAHLYDFDVTPNLDNDASGGKLVGVTLRLRM